MSEDTTTTEVPATDTGASEPTATAQPEPAAQTEAVNTDTTTPSTESAGESQTSTEDLTKWASAKGLEIDANNPNEVKLAQMQREAEKKMHQTTAQASELRQAVNQEYTNEIAGLPDDQAVQMQAQLQQLQVNQAINDFYVTNPEAREYDQDMAKLVNENPQLAAGGLEALYAVARQRKMDSGGKDQLKAEGGQQALNELAQKQRAAAPSANASSYQPAQGVTREEVRARTEAGDVAWLSKNSADIDALYK